MDIIFDELSISPNSAGPSVPPRPFQGSISADLSSVPADPPGTIRLNGRPLIVPRTALAAVVMGAPRSLHRQPEIRPQSRELPPPEGPVSNLTRLLSEQQQQLDAAAKEADRSTVDEADSACGPTRTAKLGSSAPLESRRNELGASALISCQISAGAVLDAPLALPRGLAWNDRVRRCMSSKELGTLAPPSGSPYVDMLSRKEELEESMRKRLQQNRHTHDISDGSCSGLSRHPENSNKMRNHRRARHAQAVIDDLCDIVAELFVAESKLLNLTNYGVSAQYSEKKESIISTVHSFISALPERYALGVETPSEVLLHMRLMAAARSDKTKVAVHIHNIEEKSRWVSPGTSLTARPGNKSLRLVTISCNDAVGLLEYISKLLATSGSRVLDADVMLSRDGIVLDRFVVEMSGRLRLDKLSNLVEAFLKDAEASNSHDAGKTRDETNTGMGGPLYIHHKGAENYNPRDIQHEMESAVPLSDVLASSGQLDGPLLPMLRRKYSQSDQAFNNHSFHLQMRQATGSSDSFVDLNQPADSAFRRKHLVNRKASHNLDDVGNQDDEASLDYLTIPTSDLAAGDGVGSRAIPLIPFDELMLIETLGTGRVSTIYRAAWQRHVQIREQASPIGVVMVALKVAMVNSLTHDTSHVDELRREADIAARLKHPNIADLVGVAADAECFCLAYEFCEGGSLLSLLSDSSRYYEYLPIALDIANGMAYLHSRNVIHRDLKPSNVLLTRDHRAKIADFGMSVDNTGQELTAETGTYRYMAPEVIRHEPYSSNADVYSFGLVLWQLITREVPFASLTPIQAAYAVAEGRRPVIPRSTPRRLQEIILACWDQNSHRRPSFTYVAMALADYAKMAFSPANVGALTLQIANEMLATVEGNSTVNVDFTTRMSSTPPPGACFVDFHLGSSRHDSNVGLEIE